MLQAQLVRAAVHMGQVVAPPPSVRQLCPVLLSQKHWMAGRQAVCEHRQAVCEHSAGGAVPDAGPCGRQAVLGMVTCF